MTQPARSDPARTLSASDHARAGPVWPGVLAAMASAAARAQRPGRPVPGWAVISAGLSPVLVIGGWLVADAFQPVSYSPVRETISALAGHGGTDRWIMTGALLLVGGCHLVTAAGLTGVRVAARVLLGIAGLSSIGIAVFPEPVRGSIPQHLAWTALGAVAIAIWPAFTARRTPARPMILSVGGCAAVTAVFVVMLGWLTIQTQGGDDLGLAERLTTSVQTCWPFIVALALRRAPGTTCTCPTAALRARSSVEVPDGQDVLGWLSTRATPDGLRWDGRPRPAGPWRPGRRCTRPAGSRSGCENRQPR